MRPAYKIMPAIFMLAVFAGDWSWAEINSSKKGRPPGAVKPQGQMSAALPPGEKTALSVDGRNDLSEQLFDVSGLKKLWRNAAPSSVFEHSQFAFMGLSREHIAILERVYSITFDAEAYYRDLLGVFRRSLNKSDVSGTIQWFGSVTGRKVVQMEMDSQAMDISQKISAMAGQIQGTFPLKPRLAAVKKLEKAMDLTNIFLAISQLQLQAFLPLEKEFEGEPITALLTDLKGSVWIQPLRARMLMSLLYTYKALSDEELASFADFAESAPGAWFYQLRKKALIDAQNRIIESAAEQVAMIQQAIRSGEGKQYIRQMLPPGARYLFAQGRDPFNPLSRMKSEIGKAAFARLLSQEEEEERRDRERKEREKKPGMKKGEKSKMPRFGPELKSLRAIPLEVYNNLKRNNTALYQELEHYGFLFKDKKELMEAEDKDYLDAVANYKDLIEKVNRMKGEIILPSPLQVPYESLKASGVIWNGKEPMALLETSDNLGYTLRKGSLVGPAYGVVDSIDPNKIVVVERERDYLGNTLSKSKAIEFVQSNINEGRP